MPKVHPDGFDVEAEDGRFLGRFFREEIVRVVLGDAFKELSPGTREIVARVLGSGRIGTVRLIYKGITFFADASLVHPIRVPRPERKVVRGRHGR